MDNFKRFTSGQNSKKASIDGFVGSARPVGRNTYDRNRTLRPSPSATGRTRQQRPAAAHARPNTSDVRQTQRLSTQPNKQSGQYADESMRLDMPAARSGKRTKTKEKRSIFRKSISTLMILFLVGGGYMFGKGYLSILQIFRGGGSAAALNENVDPSQLRGEGDGRVNVLLLGRGGDGHEGVDLTDTIIVASIDPVNKKAALLSIPRDLWVQPEGYGGMKVNSVFASGKNMAGPNEDPNEAGMQLLEETLEESIGIPMHYHVLVDFEGFKQAVDTVGGVTFEVPEELAVYDYMHYEGQSYILDVKSGMQEFDGLRALMFARTRKTSPRGDFDRSERQRAVMLALKDKVFSLGTYSNPLKVNELLGNLGNHVSSNLTTDEVMRLYEIMQEIPNNEIASVGLADAPNNFVTTDNINGLSVVVPRAGIGNFEEIKSFVRNALRDGFLMREDATVSVYNGTMVGGLAGRTASELESFGYNVNEVSDAPEKGQIETILVDLTGGEMKYTKAYLEKRFNVTAVSSIPMAGIEPGDADFVIILGTNEESRLEN